MMIDEIFMEFVHILCIYLGFILTPFFRFVSFLGEKAWFFILIGLILSLRKKTRWVGITILFSILIAFVLNSSLKNIIMRMRPYTASNKFQDYWRMAGAIHEINYSMPSGHSAGISAFFASLYLTSKKDVREKVFIIGIISTVLMILSRTYQMHHYFSDCIVGIIEGILMAIIGKIIVKYIYKFFKNIENTPFGNFVLSFDILEMLFNK